MSQRDAGRVQLELVELRIAGLDQRLTERMERLAEQMAAMAATVEAATQSMAASAAETARSLDAIAVQSAQTNAQIRATNQAIDRLTNAMTGHLDLERAQAANIAELTKLATRLLERSA